MNDPNQKFDRVIAIVTLIVAALSLLRDYFNAQADSLSFQNIIFIVVVTAVVGGAVSLARNATFPESVRYVLGLLLPVATLLIPAFIFVRWSLELAISSLPKFAGEIEITASIADRAALWAMFFGILWGILWIQFLFPLYGQFFRRYTPHNE